MNELSEKPDLKEINAYKKKLTWGDVPAIYHMVSSSIGEVDGILTHGFDNPYKRLLNRNTWNLELLGGYKDNRGNIEVKTKPKISLEHVFDQENYELHCYPLIDGEKVHISLLAHPNCPFTSWVPESMGMLFRISSFISFMTYAFQKGDKADMALLRFAFFRVEELINILRDSFEVVDVKGYNIAEFCKEIARRKGDMDISDLTNTKPE